MMGRIKGDGPLLREALAQHLSVPHVVLGGDSGMHLTVRLPPEYPDQAIAEAALTDDAAHLYGPVLGLGALRAEIAAGRLKAGDQIPPERTFAEDLGISRATLHRKMKRFQLH